jgi:Xaa-Pro aminopeptidase
LDLAAIQRALKSAGLDGWLFWDFHHRDPLAYRILGLDEEQMTTRRWFYWVPSAGEPTKLAHRVEPHKLDRLPGRQAHYLGWQELHAKLATLLPAGGRVAMQYSPLNHVPSMSLVDAGTVELIRSLGPEVVSSADLVQQFEATFDEEGVASHGRAAAIVHRVKDEAFERMGRALRDRTRVTENEIKDFILGRFEEQGLTTDGAVPIVGFNDHPADPHFEPTAENAAVLGARDTVLLDLWAREREPGSIYYDITWCGYCGDAPPPRYAEIFDVARRARDAALELVRQRFAAGEEVRGYEVDRAARAVVEEAGWGDRFLHRTGHSIGREVHGNGANIDDLETRDERRLVPGTCFSIEPGIYLEGEMAVRCELDVVLTPAGEVRVFGPIQQELVRIG